MASVAFAAVTWAVLHVSAKVSRPGPAAACRHFDPPPRSAKPQQRRALRAPSVRFRGTAFRPDVGSSHVRRTRSEDRDVRLHDGRPAGSPHGHRGREDLARSSEASRGRESLRVRGRSRRGGVRPGVLTMKRARPRAPGAVWLLVGSIGALGCGRALVPGEDSGGGRTTGSSTPSPDPGTTGKDMTTTTGSVPDTASDSGCSFRRGPDGGGTSPIECDTRAQDCPDGEKCMP